MDKGKSLTKINQPEKLNQKQQIRGINSKGCPVGISHQKTKKTAFGMGLSQSKTRKTSEYIAAYE